MEPLYKIKMAGDLAVSVEFRNEISEAVNNQVTFLKDAIMQSDIAGIGACIPTYRALLIQYDPLIITYKALSIHIESLMDNVDIEGSAQSKVYVIPVCYGEEFGPDLETVMSNSQLSREDVIGIHSKTAYRIYMLGFTPGFPYLGGMDERIATPRLQTPRTKIHAGSVGIAGKQTGIYPIDSPGGWQIIGRTPLKLFDIHQSPPVLLEAGNYIRFKPVDMETYKHIEKLVADNRYTCEIELLSQEV